MALEKQNGQPSLVPPTAQDAAQAQQITVTPLYDQKQNGSPNFLSHKLGSTPSHNYAKQSVKTTDMTPQQEPPDDR